MTKPSAQTRCCAVRGVRGPDLLREEEAINAQIRLGATTERVSTESRTENKKIYKVSGDSLGVIPSQ